MNHQTLGRLLLSVTVILIAVLGVGALGANTDSTYLASGPTLISPPVQEGDEAVNAVKNRSFAAQKAFEAAYPRGVPPNAFQRGIRQAHLMNRPHQVATPWKELGPFQAAAANVANPSTKASSRVSGRVISIAVDPSTCAGTACRTMYVGTYGGLWKTIDSGQNWMPLTDNQDNLTIGVITLDPVNPNIIYAGTGDPSGERGGEGILRSLDGGRTWLVLGVDQFYSRAISGIVVDPRTAGGPNSVIYVTSTSAAAGGSITGGQTRSNYLPTLGFYYSRDGGATWTVSNPRQYKYSDKTGGLRGRSLVMDPQNANVLYAGFTWDGVYKSGDDGRTWTHLGNGLPDDGFNGVVVGLSRDYSQWVYAAVHTTDKGAGHLGVYRSQDGGANWKLMDKSPNACDTQCSSSLVMAVDPTNPYVVYVGGQANYGYLFNEDRACQTLAPLASTCHTALMKTMDGGESWGDMAENGTSAPLHPDAHSLLIDPSNPSVVYAGSDGGIFHTTDGGTTWEDLNTNLRTLLAQGISINNAGSVYLGTQDNGSFVLPSGSNTWTHIAGGDGGFTVADPQNSNISYDSRYGAHLFRNDHAGAAYKETNIASFWADFDGQDRGMFYEPYAVAPTASQDLFFGTYRVWRSLTRGGKDGNKDGIAFNDKKDKSDWVPISFDLSCPQQPNSPAQQCRSDATYDGISALAVSPVNPNVMAVTTSTGQVWYTQNALAPVKTDRSCDARSNKTHTANCNFVSGVTWTRIDSGLPQRFPTSISFYPGSSNNLYMTYAGFNEDTPNTPGHVFFTNDTGQHWYKVDGAGDEKTTLPNLPFNDVVVNPTNGHLYASADYGVYVSTDFGAHWQWFDVYLPSSPVYQMMYYPKDNWLLVATFGRGVWATSAP